MRTDEELAIDLSKEEVEYLRRIHNAQALRELTKHPGWEIFQKVIADMIARLENQHLNFAREASRDAYWGNGLRLGAVREFAKILSEKIVTETNILDQPLKPPKPIDPADLDGYIHRNGHEPEGE